MGFVDVYFSLGSNLGDRKANILKALDMMDRAFCSPRYSLSSIIETPAVGFNGPAFLNCVARYRIFMPKCTPEHGSLLILEICKYIEQALGREEKPLFDDRGERQYFSRPIDIDILLYGNASIDCPRPSNPQQRLTIPHQGMESRDFVMIPLREIKNK